MIGLARKELESANVSAVYVKAISTNCQTSQSPAASRIKVRQGSGSRDAATRFVDCGRFRRNALVTIATSCNLLPYVPTYPTRVHECTRTRTGMHEGWAKGQSFSKIERVWQTKRMEAAEFVRSLVAAFARLPDAIHGMRDGRRYPLPALLSLAAAAML